MITNFYSFYDSASQTYGSPFTAPTQSVALRILEAHAMNPDSNLKLFPRDYTLYKLGQFNDENGLILPPKIEKERITNVEEHLLRMKNQQMFNTEETLDTNINTETPNRNTKAPNRKTKAPNETTEEQSEIAYK